MYATSNSALYDASRRVAVLATIVYVIVGLGASAYEPLSRLAAVAAFSAVAFSILARPRLPTYIFAYLLFVLYMAASSLWADHFPGSALGNYMTAALGAVLFMLVLSRGFLSMQAVCMLLLVPAFLNVGAYLAGIDFTASMYGIEPGLASKRFGGLIGHPNALTTRLLLPLLAVTLLLAMSGPSRVRSLLLVLSIAISFFVMSSTGSRKSVLIAAPLLLASWMALAGKTSKWLKAITYSSLLCLCAIGGAVVASSHSALLYEFQDIEVVRRFDLMLNATDDSAAERRELVLLAPGLVEKAPFFGHGLDGFARVTGRGYYSHNNAVDLAVNAGLVGLILYYSLITLAIIATARNHGYTLACLLTTALIALDLTGVSYGDRGTQVALALILYHGVRPPNKHKLQSHHLTAQ